MFIHFHKPHNYFLIYTSKIFNRNAHIYHILLNSYKSESVIRDQIIIVILYNAITIILKFLIIFNYTIILILLIIKYRFVIFKISKDSSISK